MLLPEVHVLMAGEQILPAEEQVPRTEQHVLWAGEQILQAREQVPATGERMVCAEGRMLRREGRMPAVEGRVLTPAAMPEQLNSRRRREAGRNTYDNQRTSSGKLKCRHFNAHS